MKYLLSVAVGVALFWSGSMLPPTWAGPAGERQGKKGERSAEIESQPQPDAGKSGRPRYSGTVTVRAILRASGEVTDIEVVEIKPDDLPEDVAEDWSKKCTEAARRIKFKPAMKSGRPVSQYVKLTYSFKEY